MREKQRTSFVHGVIVHKGTLVVADVLNDEHRLTEEAHVILRTVDCLTKNSLLFGSARETVIDVVQEDYFAQYLKICRKDLRLCADHLKSLVKNGWISDDMEVNKLGDSPYNPYRAS